MNVAVIASVGHRRLKDAAVGDGDCKYGIAMHLSPLAGLLAGPLVFLPILLWAVGKDKSPFVDDHGREISNAVLSFLLYNVIAIVSVIGIIALPVLYILGIISVVRAAVASARGEYFRYPMTIRFL